MLRTILRSRTCYRGVRHCSSTPATPPPTHPVSLSITNSPIAFSQTREDPQIECSVISRLPNKEKLKVLMIGSGGCSVLKLLSLPSISHLHVVDINPAQIHLVELKIIAVMKLHHEEYLQFIGAVKPIGGLETYRDEQRVKIYKGLLRESLTPDCQAFWDKHTDEIDFGINRCGRFEHMFRLLSNQLTGEGGTKEVTEATKDLPIWKPTFGEVFETEKLTQIFGQEAVTYSVDRTFSEHFASRFAMALSKWKLQNNYFLNSIFDDQYLLKQCPPYLEATTYHDIKKRLKEDPSLYSLVQGDFWKLQGVGDFDLIHTSNISDWMPVDEIHLMLENIQRNLLAPGGGIVMRRLNGDHNLAEIAGKYFHYDKQFSKELLEADRSFFYNEVVVCWKNVEINSI